MSTLSVSEVTGIINITTSTNLNVASLNTVSINATSVNASSMRVLGNLVAAPASPVQGDIIYFNGTTWTRLAPGTAGQVLKTQGTGANPVWGEGGLAPTTLLSQALPTAANNLVINSTTITTTYKMFSLIISEASHNTGDNSTQYRVELSGDNGSTYSAPVSIADPGNSSRTPGSDVKIYGADSTTLGKAITAMTIPRDTSSGTATGGTFGGATFTSAANVAPINAAVNAIRVSMSSTGAWDAGSVTLIGWK